MNLKCLFGFHSWYKYEVPGQEMFAAKILVDRCSACGKAPLLPLVAPGIRELRKQLLRNSGEGSDGTPLSKDVLSNLTKESK